MRATCLALVVGLAATFGASRRAEAEELSPALRVAIMLKVASFDHKLSEGKAALKIGIVADQGSQVEARALLAVFSSGTKITVGGRPVRAAIVEDNATGVDLLYLPKGVSGAVTAIRSARSLGVPVFSGDIRDLSRGAAVAIVARGGRPAIYVSKSAAKGILTLDPRLLRLAKVVE